MSIHTESHIRVEGFINILFFMLELAEVTLGEKVRGPQNKRSQKDYKKKVKTRRVLLVPHNLIMG